MNVAVTDDVIHHNNRKTSFQHIMSCRWLFFLTITKCPPSLTKNGRHKLDQPYIIFRLVNRCPNYVLPDLFSTSTGLACHAWSLPSSLIPGHLLDGRWRVPFLIPCSLICSQTARRTVIKRFWRRMLLQLNVNRKGVTLVSSEFRSILVKAVSFFVVIRYNALQRGAVQPSAGTVHSGDQLVHGRPAIGVKLVCPPLAVDAEAPDLRNFPHFGHHRFYFSLRSCLPFQLFPFGSLTKLLPNSFRNAFMQA